MQILVTYESLITKYVFILHINITPFSVMNDKLAAKVLSTTVSKQQLHHMNQNQLVHIIQHFLLSSLVFKTET